MTTSLTPSTPRLSSELDAVRDAVHNISSPYRDHVWTASLTHPVPKGRIEALEKAMDALWRAYLDEQWPVQPDRVAQRDRLRDAPVRLYVLTELVRRAYEAMPDRMNNSVRVSLTHAALYAEVVPHSSSWSSGETRDLEDEARAALTDPEAQP